MNFFSIKNKKKNEKEIKYSLSKTIKLKKKFQKWNTV